MAITRKQYTAKEKASLLTEWESAPDKTAFAKAHGMSPGMFWRWKKAVKKGGGEQAIEKVEANKNGHTPPVWSLFRTFQQVERELSRVPKNEALEILNYVKARLTGERAR